MLVVVTRRVVIMAWWWWCGGSDGGVNDSACLLNSNTGLPFSFPVVLLASPSVRSNSRLRDAGTIY